MKHQTTPDNLPEIDFAHQQQLIQARIADYIEKNQSTLQQMEDPAILTGYKLRQQDYTNPEHALEGMLDLAEYERCAKRAVRDVYIATGVIIAAPLLTAAAIKIIDHVKTKKAKKALEAKLAIHDA
jgi:hypothetical protein